jgi:hypothetical protein
LDGHNLPQVVDSSRLSTTLPPLISCKGCATGREEQSAAIDDYTWEMMELKTLITVNDTSLGHHAVLLNYDPCAHKVFDEMPYPLCIPVVMLSQQSIIKALLAFVRSLFSYDF